MQKAFTMIELVFAIVVIGILAAVAVPKMAPIIGDAQEAKAKSTLSSVRSAMATERQKRILRGDIAHSIEDLALKHGEGDGWGLPIFDYFDGNESLPLLDYPPRSCKSEGQRRSCWRSYTKTFYNYFMSDGTRVKFSITKGRNILECKDDNSVTTAEAAACKTLSQ